MFLFGKSKKSGKDSLPRSGNKGSLSRSSNKGSTGNVSRQGSQKHVRVESNSGNFRRKRAGSATGTPNAIEISNPIAFRHIEHKTMKKQFLLAAQKQRDLAERKKNQQMRPVGSEAQLAGFLENFEEAIEGAMSTSVAEDVFDAALSQPSSPAVAIKTVRGRRIHDTVRKLKTVRHVLSDTEKEKYLDISEKVFKDKSKGLPHFLYTYATCSPGEEGGWDTPGQWIGMYSIEELQSFDDFLRESHKLETMRLATDQDRKKDAILAEMTQLLQELLAQEATKA
eukprot:Clim_evm97s210 gene=Clim_evmTU97s210